MRFRVGIIVFLALMAPFNLTAGGVSVKYMFEQCQPLSQKGFKAETLEDLVCFKTIETVVSASKSACMWFKYAKDDGRETNMLTVMHMASEAEDTEAAIQAFLNWARTEPQYWDNIMTDLQSKWLFPNWPCRVDLH